MSDHHRSPSAADLVEEGRALHHAGRLHEAERRYAQALARDKEHAEAHHLLAVIAGQRGELQEAIAGFLHVIELAGPTAERCYNLAEAHRVAGNFPAALAAYNQALTLDAGFLDAYRNCGGAARDLAMHVDGEKAKHLRRLAAHYFKGLGHQFVKLDNQAEAESAYQEALALNPDDAELHNVLGMLAFRRRQDVEPEKFLRRAIELDPGSAVYRNNLGLVLLAQIRPEEATELFQQALEIDPSFEEARVNLEARQLAILHYRDDATPEAVFAAHRDWGEKIVSRAREMGYRQPFANSRDPHRPLKIGYVSPDFRRQVMRHFLGPLIEHHNRKEFQVFAYAEVEKPDDATDYFRRLIPNWRSTVGLSATEVADMVEKDGIDILIDPVGHAMGNRLDVFALKPAPVSVTWLGYPDTTGLSTVDYRITDAVADPPGMSEHLYTERLFRLSRSLLSFRPATSPPPAPGPARARGTITFGSVNNPRKISPSAVKTWSRILHLVPDSRLFLRGIGLADLKLVERFRTAFAAEGVPAERLTIVPPIFYAEAHLAGYSEIDIALDPFPYNGTTTTCEALWMGVPVIAFRGDRYCARVGASLLSSLGLYELIAETLDDYVAKATALALDLKRLEELRNGLRSRMRLSPLMDEPGYTRDFEWALREMWRNWCASAS